MSDKTVINNWNGGGTLQTWTDGEWQILYAKDSAGSCVTLSLTSQDAIRLAYAVSPIPNEQFERLRAANEAVYELSYPEARSDELREIANEIDCGGGCEGCSPQKIERGDFCGFVAAGNLRKLAAALDLKAALSHQPAPVAANASGGASNDPVLLRHLLKLANGNVERLMDEKAANASAEARLREALIVVRDMIANEMIANAVTDIKTMKPLKDVVEEALSTHPHASDCDKQGER